MADAISKSKGIAILPIVQALRASSDDVQRALPIELHHYLTDAITPSGWYRDDDWLTLLRALASGVAIDNAPQGAYVMFGRMAALRDLADDQTAVPEAARTDTGGMYRQLTAGKLDPVGLMRRMAKIWSLYHDSGHIELARDPQRSNVIVYRLDNYALAQTAGREVFEINRGYAEEYGKLAGVPCKVLKIYATLSPSDSWAMDVQFPETPANLESIRAL